MSEHAFQPTTYHLTFGPHPAVLTVASGDVVRTRTIDAAGHDEHDAVVAERGNPLTGPFAVAGAVPGDVLAVTIRSVRPNRRRGFSSAALAPVTVDPEYVWELEQTERRIDWSIDLEQGVARPALPIEGLADLAVPLAPMLGCIGVAPARGQAISAATSGPYGGNVDYRHLGPGVTLRFPVFQRGALLFVGDVHAAQGAGELTGTGIEVSADVELELRLEAAADLASPVRWPRGETDRELFTIGAARPLDQALQHATTEMVRWLRADYGMSAEAASVLIGQVADLDVGNMFDPAYTMVCRVGKRYLAGR